MHGSTSGRRVRMVSKVFGEVVTFKGGGAQDLVLHRALAERWQERHARDDSQLCSFAGQLR